MSAVTTSAARHVAFAKGHGTHNDFVLVPAVDGVLDLSPEEVAAICDRRAGIGADGLIRVVPTALVDDPLIHSLADRARWFMDYRNADGSLSEMCGNGTRVFAEYLRREGLESAAEFTIATRAGVKTVRADGDGWAVELGPWRLLAPEVADRDGFDALVHLDEGDPYSAVSVDLGNPHTVVALPEAIDLHEVDLTVAPPVKPRPTNGTNIEVIRPVGPGHLAMRVHERGVGGDPVLWQRCLRGRGRHQFLGGQSRGADGMGGRRARRSTGRSARRG